ncbi:proline-rich protein 14 isoform X2 [Pelobates fuscus]
MDTAVAASPGVGVKRRERYRVCLASSPLERQQRRILTVALKDIAQEGDILQSGPHDSVSKSCVLSPEERSKRLESPPPAVLPSHSYFTPIPDLCQLSSPSEPPASTAKVTGWSLVPLLHSVRSKIESFAEIFLTPMKSRRNPEIEERSCSGRGTGEEFRPLGTERIKERPQQVQEEQSQEKQKVEDRIWESSSHPLVHTPCEQVDDSIFPITPPLSHSLDVQEERVCSVHSDDLQEQYRDGTGEHELNDLRSSYTTPKTRTGLNIQLKIAMSRPVHALCRPPLQRCISCPSLPLSPILSAPSSAPARLGILGESSEPTLYSRSPYSAHHSHKRRHSVSTMEENRETSLSVLSLSCLRKEKHPYLLCQAASSGIRYQQEQFGKLHHLGSTLFSERSSQRPCFMKKCLRQPILQTPVEHASISDCEVKEQENNLPMNVRKVSDFQIRKRPTKQEGNLTPLGLPKRARLQKEEFSLEEIYTNKNYRTPTEKRTFETIFEEPVMKSGNLVLTSQRPLKRLIVFRDGSVRPRKRRRKGKGGVRSHRRKTSSVEEKNNLECLLEHKLAQLEAALQAEELELS